MRLDLDEWALRLAEATAGRATCIRRSVGCVFLDKRGNVLATGYNGVARGVSHCNESVRFPVYHDDPRVTAVADGQSVGFEFCGVTVAAMPSTLADTGFRQCIAMELLYPYACVGSTSPSGANLDECDAIHAEQNCAAACREPWEIATAYVTTAPCVSCTKLLLATSCERVVFRREYAASGEELWTRAGRIWSYIPSSTAVV